MLTTAQSLVRMLGEAAGLLAIVSVANAELQRTLAKLTSGQGAGAAPAAAWPLPFCSGRRCKPRGRPLQLCAAAAAVRACPEVDDSILLGLVLVVCLPCHPGEYAPC